MLSLWIPAIALVIACVTDLLDRRIPNWLSLPFLAAGLLFRLMEGRLAGVGQSIGGIALACVLFGIPCFLRAMGMGDLKLAAGVGAWIGASQLFTAWIFTALAGGAIAIGYALWHGSLSASLDSAGDLLTLSAVRGSAKSGSAAKPSAASIPYAPAIAIGTLLSFLAR